MLNGLGDIALAIRRARNQFKDVFMQRFEGRVVFITGGGHGIGRATARRLVSEGATVALADIDIAAAKAVSDHLGGSSVAIRCDVTDSTSVRNAIGNAVTRFGRLDILVNTVGGGLHEGPIETAIDADWQRLIELNLVGVMRCMREAMPHLLKSSYGGSIVSVGSVNGVSAFGGNAYSAAKAGLELLTRNLAAEYGSRGVRCNLIAPGTIDTRVWDNQPGSRERLAKLYPLGRIGTPEDVAAAVAFLASDDAAWITGVTLLVDGGVLTGPRAVLRME
jgi:NAD(P)-dependent dehydrogenase (short-subunit alcohol dehydrogenase family)